MRRLTNQGWVSLIVICSLPHAWAGNAALGIARANGPFEMDGSAVKGNATIFAGSTIATRQATSRLQMKDGGRVELAPLSRVKFNGVRMLLEQGGGEFASPASAVEARTLKVAPEGANAVARVKMEGEKAVLVAALNGRVRVWNSAGDLVANIEPGLALSFIPEPAQAENSVLSGCLRKVENRYLLTDTTANKTVELRGAGLEENAGKTVQITGSLFRTAQPAAGASEVIRVTEVKVTGDRCDAPAPAAKASGKEAAKAPKSGGMSSGVWIAIIAAGGGGAAAAAVLASHSSRSR